MEFYLTGMGRRFFEGTMPQIAGALERIADRLATAEKFSATLEQVAPPVDATADRVAELEAALAECLELAGHQDDEERDDALGRVRDVLEQYDASKVDDATPPDGDELDNAAILNVRRGMKRAVELIKALGEAQILPGIHRAHQNELLRIVADFVAGHVESYGSKR
jgi:hypothetical protein